MLQQLEKVHYKKFTAADAEVAGRAKYVSGLRRSGLPFLGAPTIVLGVKNTQRLEDRRRHREKEGLSDDNTTTRAAELLTLRLSTERG